MPSDFPLGLPGGASVFATDMNNGGVIVGSLLPVTGGSQAFRWNGSFEPIPFGPGTSTSAGGINNLGHVCGISINSTSSSTTSTAKIWDGINPPRTLIQPPKVADYTTFSCNDLNENGWMTGSTPVTDASVGYVWNGSTFIELGNFGGKATTPSGLNDLGVVVGQASLPEIPPGIILTHGFVWKGGTMRDLNDVTEGLDPGWILWSAAGINNSGQIAALAVNKITYGPDTRYRTVRLDPIR